MGTIADFEVTGEASLDPEHLIGDIDAVLAKLDEFETRIDEISHKLDEIGNKGIRIEVVIDGKDKLDELKLFLDELDAHVYKARVQVDVLDKDKLDKLYIDILELELHDHNVDVKVKTDGLDLAMAKLEAFNKVSDDTSKKLDKAADSGNKFKFSMLALAPALIPVSGIALSAVGAVGGLAAAFGAMAVPALAFGYSMKSVYTEASTLVSGLTAAQQAALSNATSFGQVTSILDKSSTAYQNMNSYMRNVVTEYVLMKNAVSQFQDAIQPQVVVALGNVFTIIKVALADLAPAVVQFGRAFNGVLGTLLQRLQDPTFRKFFADATTWMGALVTSWGDGFINIIEGITALLDAFLPMGVKMSSGFLKITREFDIWAQHLSQSQGFKTFVATVERDGPTILKIIGNIAEIIGRLVLAMGTSKINGSIFDTILKFLQGINKYLGTHASLTQMAADLTLVGIAAWKLGPALGPLLSFIATPVGAVVVGVLALAAGFIYLYTHSKAFHDWVNQNLLPMFQALKSKAIDMKNFLVGVWPEIEAAWKKYGGNILAIIMSDFRFIEATIINVMTFIEGFINLVLGLLSGNWHQVWHGISQMFGATWKEILATATFFGNTFMNMFSMLWKFVSTLFMSALHGIMNNFDTNMRQIENWVSSAYHNVINTVKSWMADFATWIANGLSGVLGMFTRFPGDVVRWLGNMGSILVNAGVQLIQGFINGIVSMFSSVSSTLSSLTNWLTSWKGPPEKDRTLLYNSGQMIIDGFINGLESRYSKVSSSLGGLTNTIGSKFGGQFSTDISAKLNASLNSQIGSTAVGSGGNLGGGSLTIASGAITINNPTPEPASQSLSKMLQSTAAFGIVQAPMGAAFPGGR